MNHLESTSIPIFILSIQINISIYILCDGEKNSASGVGTFSKGTNYIQKFSNTESNSVPKGWHQELNLVLLVLRGFSRNRQRSSNLEGVCGLSSWKNAKFQLEALPISVVIRQLCPDTLPAASTAAVISADMAFPTGSLPFCREDSYKQCDQRISKEKGSIMEAGRRVKRPSQRQREDMMSPDQGY